MNKKEKLDLILSWLLLSIAFYIAFRINPIICFLAVGTGFVFHELAHRQAARKFGFHSEYRAWYPSIVFSLILAALTGFVFAAPGATYFFANNVSRKQNGIISIAGPVVNLVIGIFFLMLLAFFATSGISFFGFRGFLDIVFAVAQINFFFAFFNMLPILMLDGSKVFAWDKRLWAIVFVASGALVFFSLQILSLFGIRVF